MTVCGLTIKDAKSLMSLDNGERLDYFDDVRTTWASQNPTQISTPHLDKVVANWSVSPIPTPNTS